MSNKLIVIASLTNALTAHSMRLLLEASGIRAFVTGDFPSEHGTDFVQVLVNESDADVAEKILTEVPAASEVLIPEWICVCGATVDSGFHVCWSCGADYPDEAS